MVYKCRDPCIVVVVPDKFSVFFSRTVFKKIQTNSLKILQSNKGKFIQVNSIVKTVVLLTCDEVFKIDSLHSKVRRTMILIVS